MTAETITAPKLAIDDVPHEFAHVFKVDYQPDNYRKSKVATKALAKLPFVGRDKVRKTEAPLGHVESVAFPLSRIISADRDLRDWSANGSKKRTTEGRLVKSLDHARALAMNHAFNEQTDPIKLRMFEDDAHELWGMVEDGTHRVMAAKLSGEDSLVVELMLPDDPSAIDHYHGDVMAEVRTAT